MSQLQNKTTPTINVCMITYNHEKYISEAIEGVLMQKTTFPIQLVVGEDYSTDNTRAICEEYQKKYPNIIKLLPKQKNNLGMMPNFIRTLVACKSNYIALCEGDDYWTDPLKLQKQVDFLEANEEYALCAHRYNIFDCQTNETTPDYFEAFFTPEVEGLSFEAMDIFETWYTKTLTVVFRNIYDFEKLAAKYNHFRDVHLYYHILKKGKGYLFNFNGGVYNKHEGGVFSAASKIKKLIDATYIYNELAKFNDEVIPIYKKQLERVEKTLDNNIFCDRFPFLNCENYIILQLLHETKSSKMFVFKKGVQLFTSVPMKILRKAKRVIYR